MPMSGGCQNNSFPQSFTTHAGFRKKHGGTCRRSPVSTFFKEGRNKRARSRLFETGGSEQLKKDITEKSAPALLEKAPVASGKLVSRERQVSFLKPRPTDAFRDILI